MIIPKKPIRFPKPYRFSFYYRNHVVGNYNADLMVGNAVVVELKTHESLFEADEFQLLNYLKATTFEVGLLLNFGKRPEIRRKVFDNEKKDWHTTRITRLDYEM